MENIAMHEHPLLLYPVAKSIRENLNFRELLVFRQVCRDWKDLADSELAGRTVMVARGNNNLRKLMKTMDNSSSAQLNAISAFKLDAVELGESVTFFLNFGVYIKELTLQSCPWSSAFLHEILFECLPNLEFLSLSNNSDPSLGTENLLPMSLELNYLKRKSSLNLKALELNGDFCHRTDVIYRILKSSPNLKCIKQADNLEDGQLFSTWLFEIILSCKFIHLECLELDCSIIQQQTDALCAKEFPLLQRLSVNFDDVSCESVQHLIKSFNSLKSVEVGIENASKEVVQSILNCRSESEVWIAMHTKVKNKIVFPNHRYQLKLG